MHVLQVVLDFHSQSCHFFTNTYFITTFCVAQGKYILAAFICITIQIQAQLEEKIHMLVIFSKVLGALVIYKGKKMIFEEIES